MQQSPPKSNSPSGAHREPAPQARPELLDGNKLLEFNGKRQTIGVRQKSAALYMTPLYEKHPEGFA
ncbi:hypothetical protein DWB84_16455 [Saccharophagus sp. K07]|nr:hypothetical protein [Saccharophagus sp. K07]